jgi:hypothetical protein
MPPLHVALGDHAADLLAIACHLHGLPGEVLAIPDDLSHGPLHDGEARVAWMRACYAGGFEWTAPTDDAFVPWRALEARLLAEPGPVALWGGDNASEGTFVAMACARLRGRAPSLLRVTLPAGSRTHVGRFDPAELAAAFERGARTMTADEIDAAAANFEALRDEGAPRRVWNDGALRGAPADVFDALLLAACDDAWRPAARVVGDAMARCDPRQSVSDVWLNARLQAAIDAGRVETDGPRTTLRAYAVRAVPAVLREA